MNETALRKDIISIVQDFNRCDISSGTSGNVSARYEDKLLVTPTGVTHDNLSEADLLLCDLTGKVIRGDLKPSTELPFHSAIYRARIDAHAVVHTHPPYVTGLACNRMLIPAFHYMVAIAGGDSIRCADYATFGSQQLSENILTALNGRTACLMANHGMVAIGESILSAYNLTHEVENLARQYCISLSCGEPVLLGETEMKLICEKFKQYGRQIDD